MGSVIKMSPIGLPGVISFETRCSYDERGSNAKLLSINELKAEGIDFTLTELLALHSNKSVLRGLHYQRIYSQTRILSCFQGELFIAIVDVDPESETFGHSSTCVLRQPNESLFVPAGYALGTLALKNTDFFCMCGEYPFMRDFSMGIRWDDPTIGIDWPMNKENVILSGADQRLPYFDIKRNPHGFLDKQTVSN